MHTYFLQLVIIIFVFWMAPTIGFATVAGEDVQSKIQLLPRDEISKAKKHNFLLDELKDKTLVKIAETKNFPKWKIFEDEYIKFYYPDNPHIEAIVKTPKVPGAIMGGVVGTTENTFFKCYSLTLGKYTYALLLLDKANAFDDGLCMCGAVVYQKYMFHNGSLCRFDFLKNGNVKKFQILRNGFRIVLFEWTHLPMTQDAYVNFALGITLKAGTCDKAAMRKMVMDKYGFIGRLGFLEKGMTRKEIIELLGQPANATETALTYVYTENRWQTTFTINLKNNIFEGFSDDWQKVVELPAKRGSIDWIVETVEANQPYLFADESKRKPLPQKTIQYIFDRFVEVGPTAQDDDWNRLCQALNELNDLGHTDKRILPVIRKRFTDANLCQHHAAWLLHNYDPEGSQNLFAKRIRLTLDEARKKIKSENEEERDLTFSPFDDLHNLLSFLNESDSKRSSFIIEAMEHPHPDIRSDGYYFWDCISVDDAYPRLIRGLKDEASSIRQLCSKAFAESFGSPKDIPLLKKCILTEKDKETLQNLKAAVKRLEQEKQKLKRTSVSIDKKSRLHSTFFVDCFF